MARSHNKRLMRVVMVVMSLVVVALLISQLVQTTDSLQAQTLPEIEFSGSASITVDENIDTFTLTVDINQAPVSSTVTVDYVALPASATTADYVLAPGS